MTHPQIKAANRHVIGQAIGYALLALALGLLVVCMIPKSAGAAVLDANGNPARIVTMHTCMGPIVVKDSFGRNVVPLIEEMCAAGIHTRVSCHQSRKGNSNHNSGGACDFGGSGNRVAALNNHKWSARIRAHGLRDGCDFNDCGHVDDATNVGGIRKWNAVLAAGYHSHRHYGLRLARHHRHKRYVHHYKRRYAQAVSAGY